MCKAPFTRSKFSIKNFVKVFWPCKPASKTLTDFDAIELHPIFLKTLMDFDGNWPIKTLFRNQDLIQPFCLSLNLLQIKTLINLWPNFDRVNGISLTKFSLSKLSFKKLWPSFWRKLWSCKKALIVMTRAISS